MLQSWSLKIKTKLIASLTQSSRKWNLKPRSFVQNECSGVVISLSATFLYKIDRNRLSNARSFHPCSRSTVRQYMKTGSLHPLSFNECRWKWQLPIRRYAIWNNTYGIEGGIGYRSGGPGSILFTIKKKKVMGLERGPLNLVSTTEEILHRKVVAPV
jgi:hypothetical protein